MQEYLFLPELASEHGGRLDFMLAVVHWVMLALFVGWTMYFLYVLARFRRSRNPSANYTGAKGKAAKYVEVGVVVAEAILLIGFGFPLWHERVEAFPAEEESTVVRVVAAQFVWNVWYPGPDGIFGRTDITLIDMETNPLALDRNDPDTKDDITTVSQLHLPVDKPAIIHLSSRDVIHSFALQEMRVKQDAIPGLSIPVWFVPTVTTEQMREIKGNPEFNYEISCAQLCGMGHAGMRGFMTIDTPESYQAWLDKKQAENLALEDEDDFW